MPELSQEQVAGYKQPAAVVVVAVPLVARIADDTAAPVVAAVELLVVVAAVVLHVVGVEYDVVEFLVVDVAAAESLHAVAARVGEAAEQAENFAEVVGLVESTLVPAAVTAEAK